MTKEIFDKIMASLKLCYFKGHSKPYAVWSKDNLVF